MRRRSRSSVIQQDVPSIVHLWILRLLVPLGAQRTFIREHDFYDDKLAEVLGLDEWIDSASRDFDQKAVRVELRKLHQAGERNFRSVRIPEVLSRNIARLSKLACLTDTDCRILEFAVMIHNDQLLDNTADWLGEMSSIRLYYVLSVLLNIPEKEIKSSLSIQGILIKSGLISLTRCSFSGRLKSRLEMLSDYFPDHMLSQDTDLVNLLRSTVTRCSPPQLKISDYGHIASSLSILRPYLKHAITTGRKGVNIFLYGDPGTGKSQLAKVLAKEFECELFGVASEDEDGDPVNGERRLCALRAAQSFFSQQRAIILFDEVEDVFNDGFGDKSTAKKCKAWINRMLEDNSVPTLWLSNSIQSLDPAFIRRFDMVCELPIPPKSQREHIIQEACSDLIDTQTMARIAESESLAPAVVTRAASVIRSIRDDLGENGTASAIERLVCNTLEAQGHKPILSNDPNRLPDIYDPAFIHSDIDLAKVAAGLIQSKSGRLCLYGPPGTGKTAYGRWLAEQIGVPLLVKRASDLMSKWVGDNEKNIALAFKQAKQDSGLLLIDEIDSFLQDRRNAQRSWEVSLVNEMLAQMESFPGIFIASTNLMEGLDQAALRRFDLKVKFDFLKPEQTCELFHRYCVKLAISSPQSDQLARLRSLRKLTPGDFATVVRQNRFNPIKSSAGFIAALETECSIKDSAKATIGFIQ